MKLFRLRQIGKLFINLKFAIVILAIIAFTSSLGSIIEQDQSNDFYIENYSLDHPIYGFIDSSLILLLGLDHLFTTWWFILLLAILGISLISCTFVRQFPLYKNSKDYFFKKKVNSFIGLQFFIKLNSISYLKELILYKINLSNFFIYQKKNFFYGYKGLIGRISPILVHLSLIIILLGSSLGTIINFKAQEILPKGEIFHIQNPIQSGFFTSIPKVPVRVNDFWVEYDNNRVHQFYSNLSILDNYGNELKQETISVNNPLRYKNIDFYQSDWNLLGIRVIKKESSNKKFEYPLFPLKKGTKSWITWIKTSQNSSENNLNLPRKFIFIFDQLENIFFVYDENGKFLQFNTLGTIGNFIPDLEITEILPATGLLIKYDLSILFIYFGFGLLMLTACLSYLPYTQIWLYVSNDRKTNNFLQENIERKNKANKARISNCLIGCSTNRGKINVEIDFENLIRYAEKQLFQFSNKYK
jgi:cytochrome c biogenesis protein